MHLKLQFSKNRSISDVGITAMELITAEVYHEIGNILTESCSAAIKVFFSFPDNVHVHFCDLYVTVPKHGQRIHEDF